MVFEDFRPESPEANVAVWERPCLELVRPEAAGGLSSSICSKLGFLLATVQICRGRLGLRVETMLIQPATSTKRLGSWVSAAA